MTPIFDTEIRAWQAEMKRAGRPTLPTVQRPKIDVYSGTQIYPFLADPAEVPRKIAYIERHGQGAHVLRTSEKIIASTLEMMAKADHDSFAAIAVVSVVHAWAGLRENLGLTDAEQDVLSRGQGYLKSRGISLDAPAPSTRLSLVRTSGMIPPSLEHDAETVAALTAIQFARNFGNRVIVVPEVSRPTVRRRGISARERRLGGTSPVRTFQNFISAHAERLLTPLRRGCQVRPEDTVFGSKA